MAGIAEKLGKVVADRLEAGERVVAATKAFPAGGIKALAWRTAAFGVVGGAVGAAIAQSTDGGTGSAGKSGLAIGLTDRRLLACSLSLMTASPKELVGELPISRIRSVTTGGARVMAMKMVAFTLTLDDDTTQAFEIPKVSTKDGERFLAELRSRLSATPA